MARDFPAGAPGADAGVASDRHAAVPLLAISAAVGSTGLAAGGTAGALLGDQVAGSGAAGLPPGVLVIGYAVGAILVSRQAARGRRGRGLAGGYVLGLAGATVVIVAAVTRSLPLLVAGSIVLGVANASVYLTRYAAVAADAGQGRAIGAVFSATAVGAVLSSLLLGPSSQLASAIGLPPLAGLYLIAVMAFGVSALLLALGSSPLTPWAGRASSVLVTAPSRVPAGVRELRRALGGHWTVTAFAALAVTNMIMVGTMVVAPVSMMGGGDALPVIGTVVALHVAGMFAPSPATGALADRFGPRTVVLGGAFLFIADNVTAALAGVNGTGAMVAYLVVIGVAWNCGVVGGSALLAKAVSGVRSVPGSYAEGAGEVAMGVAAAAAAPLAGLVAAIANFPVYALCCAVLAAAMAGVVAVGARERTAKEWQ